MSALTFGPDSDFNTDFVPLEVRLTLNHCGSTNPAIYPPNYLPLILK